MRLDIVIPSYNNSQIFSRCIRAIEKASPGRTNLLVVDDGSNSLHRSQMEKVLRGMQYSIITHSENRGFKESIISAMQCSEAEYVLLLNDDTVPTLNFDLKLLDVIHYDDRIRAVGPVSNHPSELFQFRTELRHITCDDHTCPIELASEFERAQLTHGAAEVPFLTGMCLLLERRLFESVGFFKSSYEHGYFEDLDVCCRIRKEGYRLMVNEDCFVYHVGHATYKHLTADEKRRIILKNFCIFERNWGHLPEHDELVRKMEFAGREHPI
jgi:GT2 family glycosyltransferase